MRVESLKPRRVCSRSEINVLEADEEFIFVILGVALQGGGERKKLYWDMKVEVLRTNQEGVKLDWRRNIFRRANLPGHARLTQPSRSSPLLSSFLPIIEHVEEEVALDQLDGPNPPRRHQRQTTLLPPSLRRPTPPQFPPRTCLQRGPHTKAATQPREAHEELPRHFAIKAQYRSYLDMAFYKILFLCHH